MVIYQDGDMRLQVRLEACTARLLQSLIAELFQVWGKTAHEHWSTPSGNSTRGNYPEFRIVQAQGGRQVSRVIDHYALIPPSLPARLSGNRRSLRYS